jgi:hypothetical protein
MRASILGIIVSAVVGSFVFFGVASPAEALTVVITGTGVWGEGTTPVNGFSEPGASFAFSFELANPIPSNPADGTDFDYVLTTKEGSEEFLSPHIPVEFYTAADAGLFDLFPKKNDAEGNPVVISLYGPQIEFFSAIISGTYNDVAAGMQMEPATGTADVRVSPLTVTGFSVSPLTVTGFGGGVVPESSTWVMMTLGFAGLAFAGYRASRKRAMVA